MNEIPRWKATLYLTAIFAMILIISFLVVFTINRPSQTDINFKNLSKANNTRLKEAFANKVTSENVEKTFFCTDTDNHFNDIGLKYNPPLFMGDVGDDFTYVGDIRISVGDIIRISAKEETEKYMDITGITSVTFFHRNPKGSTWQNSDLGPGYLGMPTDNMLVYIQQTGVASPWVLNTQPNTCYVFTGAY